MMSPALALAILAAGPSGVEKIGRLAHPAIAEASGIVASRTHPGIFWVHNDSGNPASLFAVRVDGSLVREYAVAAANVDWEDIAVDDAGHLYLGDIGDNLGKLPVHCLIRLDEPDPAVPPTGPLTPSAIFYFRYPGKKRLDAESLFIDGAYAMILAKTQKRQDAEVFAVKLDQPAPLLRPAKAEPMGTLSGFQAPATGADLTADRRFLAVCTVDSARVYRVEDDHWTLVREYALPDRAVEAIAWDGRDLILASEKRTLYRIRKARP